MREYVSFTQEYFVANKSMSVIPVAIGLMASYLSAVSLLGVSSEIYVYGSQYMVINISYGIATAFVVYFYLPVFFKLNATSAFEVSTYPRRIIFTLISRERRSNRYGSCRVFEFYYIYTYIRVEILSK